MQTTDIMIHVNEPLDATQQQAIESELRKMEGVIAPRFDQPHLLVVLYDADAISSSSLLDAIRGKGYQAQLIGL